MIAVRRLLPAEYDEARALAVAPDQKQFVASNADFIAEAQMADYCTPLGIHADGELVGFAMYALDPDDGDYWLYRLMIDAKHQGRGHGAEALKQILTLMAKLPGCAQVVLGVEPDNAVAGRLYRHLGFRDTGEVIGGENVMVHVFGAR